MQDLYAERQSVLVSAVEQELKGLLEVSSNEAGMYLIGWLLHNQDDQRVSEVAAAYGIEAPSLSTFRLREQGIHRGCFSAIPHLAKMRSAKACSV